MFFGRCFSHKFVSAINDCCVQSECCASVHMKTSGACHDLDYYLVANYRQIAVGYIGLIAFEIALIVQAVFLGRNYNEAENVKLYWKKRQFIEDAAELQKYGNLNEEQT